MKYACAGLLFALTACASEKSASGDSSVADTGASSLPDWRSWSPDAPGPFRAGHTVVSVTYTPSSGEGPRTIPVHVWYPTEAETGEEVRHEGLFEEPNALGEAPAASSVHEGGYPILLHSHGSQGFAGNSAFLHEHFASHGWVVLVPDHIGNTMTQNDDPRTTAHYIHRPEDLSAALDAGASGAFSSVGLPPLQVARVVSSGHSFGVYTEWAIAGATFDAAALDIACGDGGMFALGCTDAERAAFLAGLGDSRVIATVPMAGSINRSLFGEAGHTSVQTPMLSMSGTNDPVGADVQFATCPEVPLTWVDITGACHQTFGLGTCDTLEMNEGFQLVNAWVLSFARYTLLADTTDEVVRRVKGEIEDARVSYQTYVP